MNKTSRTPLSSSLVVAVLLWPCASRAAIWQWPGPAPCDQSFAQCLAQAVDGDTVRIASNATITPALNLQRAITLEAAPGFTPVFSDSTTRHLVALNPNQAWQLKLRNLRFDSALRVTLNGAQGGSVMLENLRFPKTANYSAQQMQLSVSTTQTASALTEITVQNCEFELPSDNVIQLLAIDGSVFGTLNTKVLDNRFYSTSVPAPASSHTAINLLLSGSGNHALSIGRNRVLPSRTDGSNNLTGGVSLTSFGGGRTDVLVHDNLLVLGGTPGGGTGINMGANSGASDLRIINNTVIGAYYGQTILASNVRLDNNVFMNGFRWTDAPGNPNIARNNAVFNFDNPASVPLPAGTIISNPQLSALGRLLVNSPLLESGSNLARAETSGAAIPLEALDNDRQARLVGANIDIGAYESARILYDGFE